MSLRPNVLDFQNQFSVVGGVSQLIPATGGYWFTSLSNTCYDISGYQYLNLLAKVGPGTGPMAIGIDIYDTTCQTKNNTYYYNVAASAITSGTLQQVNIPIQTVITDTASRTRIKAIVLTGFTAGATYQWDKIELDNCPGSV